MSEAQKIGDNKETIINHKFTYVNMSSLMLSSSAFDENLFFPKQWEHFKTAQMKVNFGKHISKLKTHIHQYLRL